MHILKMMFGNNCYTDIWVLPEAKPEETETKPERAEVKKEETEAKSEEAEVKKEEAETMPEEAEMGQGEPKIVKLVSKQDERRKNGGASRV